MFRLNSISAIHKAPPSTFQYFRCFGWIREFNGCIFDLDLFQYFRCFGWMQWAYRRRCFSNTVSILQMFRLNTTLSKPFSFATMFQYFRCFGWIFLPFFLELQICLSFNTSDVSVEYTLYTASRQRDYSFNTSDVSVELNSLSS